MCSDYTGYTALYMLAVFTGQVIFSYMDNSGGKAMRNIRWLALTFAATTLLLVVATFIAVRLVARPSRRMVRRRHSLAGGALVAVYIAQTLHLIPRMLMDLLYSTR